VNAREEQRLAQALDALLGEAVEHEASECARLAGELARAGAVLRARAFRRPRDEARFVASVLGRTTREDLSWRGDLRLALDFLRARLRASPALRVVAASLALHLVAAPALAWWMLREPRAERAFTLHIELPSELPLAEEPTDLEAPADELRAAAHAREARENERARVRHALGAAALQEPWLAEPTEASVAVTRFARHLAALRERRAPEVSVPAEGEGLFARALALELALDRRWLLGVEDDGSRRLAWALAQDLAQSPDARAAGFVASTLRRAWSEGVLEDEPAPAAWPFSSEWRAALARAAEAEPGAAREALLRWCDERAK